MSGYCFYSPDAQQLLDSTELKEKIDQYTLHKKKQSYVLRSPLTKNDSSYDYEKSIVIFISGHKPCFVDLNQDKGGLDDYAYDFLDDISFLSEKYKYREKIGRKKYWNGLFKKFTSETIDLESLKLTSSVDVRTVDLLTSLVVGSINDISRINLEAENLLDSIKSKIILFDTDQTTFVFKSNHGKKYSVQGLAGSGKTELLFHKLKELYSTDTSARIAFTCYNKILSSSMKNRIPNFFDFMRVERQIDWNNKLFCFHAWGSNRDPYSGMYRYICHSYGITFGTFQSGRFDDLCKNAIEDIKLIEGGSKKIFDYIFIDESQDFSDSFIDLCELVTEKKIFIAGDVFQNIFRPIDERVKRADLVLKKCYRTDPKNLMFSHAIGMGLYENPVLRWLKKSEWESCGYLYEESNNRALISRDPLRRFEDIPDDFVSTKIHLLENFTDISREIIRVVGEIKTRHPTVQQGDIAVLFLDKSKYIYEVIPIVKQAIINSFGWDVNISFESKEAEPSKFFISNINNAKGLEFPFVICFSNNLPKNPQFRNALYTMMARSFLESHLILGNSTDIDVINNLRNGLAYMQEHGRMNIRIPTEEEIENQKDLFVLQDLNSIESIVKKYCKDKGASPRLVGKLISRINTMIDDGDIDEAYIKQLLDVEYKRFMNL